MQVSKLKFERLVTTIVSKSSKCILILRLIIVLEDDVTKRYIAAQTILNLVFIVSTLTIFANYKI